MDANEIVIHREQRDRIQRSPLPELQAAGSGSVGGGAGGFGGRGGFGFCAIVFPVRTAVFANAKTKTALCCGLRLAPRFRRFSRSGLGS